MTWPFFSFVAGAAGAVARGLNSPAGTEEIGAEGITVTPGPDDIGAPTCCTTCAAGGPRVIESCSSPFFHSRCEISLVSRI